MKKFAALGMQRRFRIKFHITVEEVLVCLYLFVCNRSLWLLL